MRPLACLFVLLCFTGLVAGQGRPMTVDDLFKLERVTDPQVSPDGSQIAFVITKVDMAKNSTSSTLWLVAADGKSAPRQLTTTPKKDRRPRWSPDGKQLLFESTRSGSLQLWLMDVAGGEPKQLTDIATDASTATWSPDGKKIAFVSAVWPELSDKPYAELNKAHRERMADAEKGYVKAKVFTRLFLRHWDSYVEDKRQHLFVFDLKDGKAVEPRNLTPGKLDAFPTSMTFSGAQDYTFTPDGQFIVFCAPPEKDEAWSTNYDLWRIPVAGGKPECLTKDNPAADGLPRFSPDGKKLAYRAQQKPGFEADRWQLFVVECEPNGVPRGPAKSVSASFDSSVEDFAWAPDGKSVWFLAEQKGEIPLLRLDLATGAAEADPAFPQGVLSALSVSKDGQTRVVAHNSLRTPNEVYAHRNAGATSTGYFVTEVNKKLLGEIDLPKPESVTVAGAGGTPMQMWLLKPPGFDEKKKWPVLYLVHGGPQGAWTNGWSWRWCPELWAAQGYVVALPNPRGSTGFGQQYVDEISGDWGGRCYEDLMKGVEYLERQPYVDKDRLAAAGASFGGYMMNWFAGHTDKFKTLITHCGVFNHESMYTTTEELWFDEWEHGDGKPLWEAREKYVKFSPHLHAAKFKTPMLIIHNDLDFRVPVGQGLELFTTLQRRGIPSKFINFPDEGHWVLKPANSKFWHEEIFAWLKQYCPPGAR